VSSRREILVTITNLKKKRLHPARLFLALASFWPPSGFLETEKKLTEVSESSELVRTDIY